MGQLWVAFNGYSSFFLIKKNIIIYWLYDMNVLLSSCFWFIRGSSPSQEYVIIYFGYNHQILHVFY